MLTKTLYNVNGKKDFKKIGGDKNDGKRKKRR